MPRIYLPFEDLKLNWEINERKLNKKTRKNIGYENDMEIKKPNDFQGDKTSENNQNYLGV